ncbi:MAG TPA: papain-like cysteine protease family protein [Terriglobales bacterium]|nr:papain-like cysteine protease family protein [Terriglobales bacterium]
MDRRRFLCSAGAALALAPALRAQNCQIVPPGVALCVAEVNIPQLIASIHQQECPEWCWAASISMIFGFYGHSTDQKEIVQQKYGSVVCLPSGPTINIAQALSRCWKDDNGVSFKSRIVAAYDPANGVNAINNAIFVSELLSNHPLLYCNTHHAMVIYSTAYIPTQPLPNVRAVKVVDPWPPSPRTHELSTPEMVPAHLNGQMTFLASVRVSSPC